MVPSLGDTCDAHVLFCCPSPPGAKDLSQHLVSHAHTTNHRDIQLVWKPVVLSKEEHRSRRWGSRSGGENWGWRSQMGSPGHGNWRCLQSWVRAVTHKSPCSYPVIATCFNNVRQWCLEKSVPVAQGRLELVMNIGSAAQTAEELPLTVKNPLCNELCFTKI